MAITRQSTELERGVERQIVLQVGPLAGVDVRPSRLFVWYGSERTETERIVSSTGRRACCAGRGRGGTCSCPASRCRTSATRRSPSPWPRAPGTVACATPWWARRLNRRPDPGRPRAGSSPSASLPATPIAESSCAPRGTPRRRARVACADSACDRRRAPCLGYHHGSSGEGPGRRWGAIWSISRLGAEVAALAAPEQVEPYWVYERRAGATVCSCPAPSRSRSSPSSRPASWC